MPLKKKLAKPKGALVLGAVVTAFTVAALFATAEAWFRLSRGSWHVSRSTALDPLAQLRAPLAPREKKAAKARVLAIGGSTTFAMDVPVESSWPLLLERSSDRFEVINAGLLGSNLREELLFSGRIGTRRYLREWFIAGGDPSGDAFQEFGWKDLRPDLVIIAPQVNDSAPDLYRACAAREAPLAHRLWSALAARALFERSALGYLVSASLTRHLDSALNGAPPSRFEDCDTEQVARQLERSLEELVAFWQPRSRVVLARFPVLFARNDGAAEAERAAAHFGDQQSLDWDHQRALLQTATAIDDKALKAVASRHGLRYACAACELETRPFAARTAFYIDSIHMNARGQKLVADDLLKTLASEGL